jgi:hypothetical protein
MFDQLNTESFHPADTLSVTETDRKPDELTALVIADDCVCTSCILFSKSEERNAKIFTPAENMFGIS